MLLAIVGILSTLALLSRIGRNALRYRQAALASLAMYPDDSMNAAIIADNSLGEVPHAHIEPTLRWLVAQGLVSRGTNLAGWPIYKITTEGLFMIKRMELVR